MKGERMLPSGAAGTHHGWKFNNATKKQKQKQTKTQNKTPQSYLQILDMSHP